MEGGGLHSRRRWLLPVALLVLMSGAVALAAQAARAETGAPALELDGVWRARGDWVIDEAELIVHDGERVEVFGNLTVGTNATLSLLNGSLVFMDTQGQPRWLRVLPGALLRVSNESVTAHGAFNASIDGAVFDGTQCAVRFTGSAGAAVSLTVQDGAFLAEDCQFYSDAARVLEASISQVQTVDCDFVTLAGDGAPFMIEGPGLHVIDTTRFGNLTLEGGAGALLYATVRFFLETPGGAPAAGHVNGTSPFDETFSMDTSPGAPAAVRLTWFVGTTGQTISEGASQAVHAVEFTAFNATVGGNSTTVRVSHHRENFTVVLDGPYDIGVDAFRVVDHTFEGPPLKRAYYLQMGENATLSVTVANNGAAASSPAMLVVARAPLNPSTWAPTGEASPIGSVLVPALAPGERWTWNLSISADAFGGVHNSTTPCTQTASYTAGYRALFVPADAGDFASWDNEREFTAMTYKVEERPETKCVDENSSVLPLIAAGGIGAVAAAVALAYWFSEAQVTKRATRKAAAPKEKPRKH